MTTVQSTQTEQKHTAVERDCAASALQAQLEQLTRLSQQFSGSLQSMQARYLQVSAHLA